MPGADGQRPSDTELLRRHVAGDAEAFGELFRRHRDRLWAVALRTVCDPEEAADALQDAMVSAFRRAADLRGDHLAAPDRGQRVAGPAAAQGGPPRGDRRRAGVRGPGHPGRRPGQRPGRQAGRRRGAADPAAAAAGGAGAGRHARLPRRRRRRHPRHRAGHGEEPLRPRPRPADPLRRAPAGEPIGERERLTLAGRRSMRWQTAHLDAAAVAEFRAGLVTGRRGARTAAHLARCERCAALAAVLADVSALLAAAPVPAVPDAVARRLDSVLAAEAARRSDPERAGAAAVPERRAQPGPGGRRGFRGIAVRVLAPAAAAAAVLGGAGYGISLLAGGQHGMTAPSSAARAAAAPSSAPVPQRKAVAAPAVAGPHAAPVPTLRRSLPGFPVIASGTDYRPATAAAQLRACVSRVTGGVVPYRVETARYQGRPATVIFVRAGGGYQAWVAGPACASVVYHATLP